MEICIDDSWGTVCDDFWGVSDAMVVCRQLGLQADGIYNYTVLGNKIVKSVTIMLQVLRLLPLPHSARVQETSTLMMCSVLALSPDCLIALIPHSITVYTLRMLEPSVRAVSQGLSDWPMGSDPAREEWRCVKTTCGVPFVMSDGVLRMPPWSVVSLASQSMELLQELQTFLHPLLTQQFPSTSSMSCVPPLKTCWLTVQPQFTLPLVSTHKMSE